MNRPSWHENAACRGKAYPDFFASSTKEKRVAVAMCAICPVLETCRLAAFQEEGASSWRRHGIRGGMTANERHRLAHLYIAVVAA